MSRKTLVIAATVALAAGLATPPAAAAPTPGPPRISAAAERLEPRHVKGAKSKSGRLAKTDKKLLAKSSGKPINVVVKLDYDALASYAGDLPGLAATSPSVTGKALDPRSSNSRRYAGHIERMEGEFLTGLGKAVPGARPGRRLRTVYGGLALRLPANKVADLLKLPGVAAVHEDRLEKPLTDSSPAFIGAPAIYDRLGGSDESGKGVIVGILDTGSWPEHPQYNDPGNLPDPPEASDGRARPCSFGQGFTCNNKLISGEPFLDTYNQFFDDEPFPEFARDADGHGTHTSTTSAGIGVDNADPLGIDRGAIHGIAPAAHVAAYKVCGPQGCFTSDSAGAVARAILDGVRVINFSISGGNDPYADAVELAFLDAYAAGVLVSASAGNSGPGPDTVNHRGPWTTTVAASTQTRTFTSEVTLTGDGATETVKGATITDGIGDPLPIVKGSDPPYSNPGCDEPAPAGLFDGKIVACERGAFRALRGFNVKQGGAAGMILYNATPADVMTDNHHLPTVHIDTPDAEELLAFLDAHADTTASFPRGSLDEWQGDRITHFSSRGPGGDFLKPDVTAPGLQILAGNTPFDGGPAAGPPGNLYQAIAGTSMSAPHVTGAAALLFALHPDWTPGQVKSALETTAKTNVVKEDGTTPADPFDHGGGRIDLTKAGDPGLVLEESAEDFMASANDPRGRIDLNLPSINAPTMPGIITTERTVTNVTKRTMLVRARASSPEGARIRVSPPVLAVRPGKSAKLKVTISGLTLAEGQYFGEIRLDQIGGKRRLHLPVAFFRQQGAIPVAQTCSPDAIRRLTDRATCTVTADNTLTEETEVTAESTVDPRLAVTKAEGADRRGSRRVVAKETLDPFVPDTPRIAPGESPAGYVDLAELGVAPLPLGDEDGYNFDVPAFSFAGKTFDQIGIISNGYAVAGGAAGADVSFVPQDLPDTARPNGVLAPFWTDLDGTGAPGLYVTVLTDGVSEWLVAEWRVNLFGTSDQRVFQQWIGLGGEEDLSFTYDPDNLPGAPPAEFGLTVGAENTEGTGGSQIDGLPTEDLRVTNEPGSPGGSLSYSFEVRGLFRGEGRVTTKVTTPAVRGTTVEVDTITVE